MGRSRPGFWHQYSPGRHHIAIVLAYSFERQRAGRKKPGASIQTRPAVRTDIFPQAMRKNFTRKITEMTYVSTETSLPLPVQSLSTE